MIEDCFEKDTDQEIHSEVLSYLLCFSSPSLWLVFRTLFSADQGWSLIYIGLQKMFFKTSTILHTRCMLDKKGAHFQLWGTCWSPSCWSWGELPCVVYCHFWCTRLSHWTPRCPFRKAWIFHIFCWPPVFCTLGQLMWYWVPLFGQCNPRAGTKKNWIITIPISIT